MSLRLFVTKISSLKEFFFFYWAYSPFYWSISWMFWGNHFPPVKLQSPWMLLTARFLKLIFPKGINMVCFTCRKICCGGWCCIKVCVGCCCMIICRCCGCGCCWIIVLVAVRLAAGTNNSWPRFRGACCVVKPATRA